jgi:hypothetical protein
MADNRTPRDLNSREKTARMVYTPPSSLPDPVPEPGFSYRWVATHIMGESDARNVSLKLREGYVPVKAEDHPELQMFAGKSGNVEIGGLMLCKIATEVLKSREEYYHNQAQRQMESVDNHFMRNNDPRMPLFKERQSTVSRGSGFGSGS